MEREKKKAPNPLREKSTSAPKNGEGKRPEEVPGRPEKKPDSREKGGNSWHSMDSVWGRGTLCRTEKGTMHPTPERGGRGRHLPGWGGEDIGFISSLWRGAIILSIVARKCERREGTTGRRL